MALAKQRARYRHLAYTHGWHMLSTGPDLDVFRLQTDDDEECRYLYVGYLDIGLDLDHTFLVLPYDPRIIGVTDPALAADLVTEWIEDFSDSTEEEYRSYLEEQE